MPVSLGRPLLVRADVSRVRIRRSTWFEDASFLPNARRREVLASG
jgi:hypothetical protein